jgi:hypothetical protein
VGGAKSPGMWIRRLLGRQRKQPPFDLTALDRLEQQVARVVALVPQPDPEEDPEPAPVARPVEALSSRAAPTTSDHLLFLPGYELVERKGAPPAPGHRLEHSGSAYVVVRHGPSPLPGDGRRCAFLETA